MIGRMTKELMRLTLAVDALINKLKSNGKVSCKCGCNFRGIFFLLQRKLQPKSHENKSLLNNGIQR